MDVDLFEELHRIGDAILERNPKPALVWVKDHASKLRRLKVSCTLFITMRATFTHRPQSDLPRQLLRYQFVELLREAGTGSKAVPFDFAT